MAKAEAAEAEAVRLKSLAEKKYPTSLKSALKYARRAERVCPDLHGVSQLVTTLEVLHDHRRSADWYTILQLRPFSHPNTISKQYKKLAHLLHPANNPSPGSELAFEAVGLAFLTLSDKLHRQKYDMDLRIKLKSQQETFWTACSTCRLYHQFPRRHLGQRLLCPGCNKTFSAVEVGAVDDGATVRVRSRAAARAAALSDKKTKRHSSNERSVSSTIQGKVRDRNLDDDGDGIKISTRARARDGFRVTPKKTKVHSFSERGTTSSRRRGIKRLEVDDNENDNDDEEEEEEEDRSGGSTRDRVSAKASSEKKMKGKSSSNSKGRIKRRNVGNDDDDEWEPDGDVDVDDQDDVLLLDWLPSEKKSNQKRKINDLEKPSLKKVERGREKTLAEMQLEMKKKLGSKKVKQEKEREKTMVPTNLNSMSVEDADFYDFDKDRVERSFKKGQLWAVYDDDDGMPRHYGLIDDVVSVNPFLLKINWLDLQSNGDGALMGWEKLGFHVSCGRFKVGKKIDIDSVNCFSHVVECERAAREIYRIYPKKGSVWALYTDEAVNEEHGSSTRRGRRYDIAVFLTSYSEMHGLSMAYLEKVEGFKTIFKRREIGCHAIRWLERDDVRQFSHQIPARKVLGEEASDLPEDCWELDPASLPSDMLRI